MPADWSWLDALTPETVARDAVPFQKLLDNSVYYPACGTDGRPVEYLHHLSRSYIYVDYNISQDDLKIAMQKRSFTGYKLLTERYVTQSEITPHGWHPHEHPTAKDGNPRKPMENGWIDRHPYALWTIWQRKEGYDEKHGPLRFSLLHLCADGVAAFDALYYTWNTKPLVFCIIQPGTGYGLNWTDFRKPGHIMHRLISNNPAGMPKYMLVDDEKGYWGEYSIREDEFDKLHLFTIR